MKHILLSTTIGLVIGSMLAGLVVGLEASMDCAGAGLCGLAIVLAPLILLIQLPWIAIPGVPQSSLPFLVAIHGALLGLAVGVIFTWSSRRTKAK